MKKIIFGSFVIVIIFCLTIFLFLNRKQPVSSYPPYIIDGQIYHLIEAKNPIEWTKGLMYFREKDELKGADGMIFIFPVKMVQNFWNENTYLDLDLYWMDGGRVVGRSYLPSILKTKKPLVVKSPSEVDRVVEIIK